MTDQSTPEWMRAAVEPVAAAMREALKNAPHDFGAPAYPWMPAPLVQSMSVEDMARVALTAAAQLIADREARVREEAEFWARDELRRVQHDLEHVATERDKAQTDLRSVSAERDMLGSHYDSIVELTETAKTPLLLVSAVRKLLIASPGNTGEADRG